MNDTGNILPPTVTTTSTLATTERHTLLAAGHHTAQPGVFGRLPQPLAHCLGRWTQLEALDAVYRGLPPAAGPRDFFDQALAALNIAWDVSPEDLARIPKQGAFVAVANHPTGLAEGMLLGRLLLEARPDVKLMGNYLLAAIPELQPCLITVDPYGGRDSRQRNIAPLRQCLGWLRRGGCLGIFPAGSVARPVLHRRGAVTDPEWNANIAALIRHAGVPVVPIHFDGANSLFFHVLGALHPQLRTALFPRELLAKQSHSYSVRIGTPVSQEKIASLRTDADLSAYLRFRTFLLRQRQEPGLDRCTWRPSATPDKQLPVIEPVALETLASDVAALPAAQVLAETDEFRVYEATAAQAPHVLRELGRLREITFRQAGEGTGLALDLDRFDDYYTHLFVWHRQRQEIVGAYRVGKVDDILRVHGRRGLYTSTLFHYRPGFFETLDGAALELGRSFVRREYQKQFQPLLLLWKGIGTMIAREPRYRYLLGPVSISSDYTPAARQLMAAFLGQRCGGAEFGTCATARRPWHFRTTPELDARRDIRFLENVDELSELVGEIEPRLKGVPVLVRQYLKLGGRILALNRDPEFGDVLDGLVFVDMLHGEPRQVEKYLGKAGAAALVAAHAKAKAA